MITPLSWKNLAGTLRDQLAHLAQHLDKIEHLPCSGILKTAAAQQQQKAAGIHITPGMQRVLDVIPPHPHGVTRYDLETLLKMRYTQFKSHVHELVKAKRVISTPQGGRKLALYGRAGA